MIVQCSRTLVLELGKARIARLKCHREDKANGKDSGYTETETTARINELTSFIDRIETETFSPYETEGPEDARTKAYFDPLAGDHDPR